MAECLSGFTAVRIKTSEGELQCMGEKYIGVRSLICMGSLMLGFVGLKWFCMGKVK